MLLSVFGNKKNGLGGPISIMSLKSLIEGARKSLEVLDSPSASPEAIGAAAIFLIGNNPEFRVWVGRNVSRAMKKLAAKSTAEVEKPSSAEVVSVPTVPTPAKGIPASKYAQPVPAIPAKPVPATAPARKLVSPEARRDQWSGILGAFVASGKRIDKDRTCRFTTEVFKSSVVLNRNHWEIFFAAVQKAARIGFPIVDNRTLDLEKVFILAPADLLTEYIFSQDGDMVSVLAGFNEIGEDGQMPNWLVARSYNLVSALNALCRGSELTDEQGEFVDRFQDAVESIDGPENLIEKISLIGAEDGHATLREVARGAESLNNLSCMQGRKSA